MSECSNVIWIFNKQSFKLSAYVYRFQQIQFVIRKCFCNEKNFVYDDEFIENQYFIFLKFKYIVSVLRLTAMLTLY